MNSLRSLGPGASTYEIERQIAALDAGERIVQETRHWDEAGRAHATGCARKEGSSDYRYFPEPDLVPVAPTRGDARRGARVAAGAARGATGPAWSPSGGSAKRTRGCSSERPGSPTTPKRPRWRCRRGRRSDVVELVHRRRARAPQRDGPVAGGAAARARRARRARRPRRRRHDLAQPGQGRARRVPARAEAAEAGRRRARARAGERRGRARRGGRRGPRRPTPTWSPSTAAGDDKVKKKKRGFLMGEVMKATEGQGNPQLLNRLLDERLG